MSDTANAKDSSAAGTAKNYAIGIDLGTTNTAVGFVDLDDEHAAPAVFLLPQVVAPEETRPLSLLPSFLYQPTRSELPPGALALPWDPERAFAVGAFARDRAGSVPARVIASAKSWLVHAGVDRRAPILPFLGPSAESKGEESDVPKLSPVDVQARILAHVREAWDHAHPEAPLARQRVVLTVPASFDVVARTLTEEAAAAAGLPAHDCVLLEEPQAALYAWIAFHGDAWRKQVSPGDRILVVDVGGGTTDFSLIAVTDDGAGNLSLDREAVGDHILLGGDNMDLALAWRVKIRLEGEGKHIDDWQLRALTHSCREAKEAILQDHSVDERSVVIPGRGSKLIGGSIRASLTRAEVQESLLEGFFPVVSAGTRAQQPRRAGLQTLGLPYASDAAITRHLAAFCNGQQPTALLFNGGVTRSALVQQRIVDVVNSWGPAVRVLQGADLDLAVAKGAAAYARVRANKKGLRIKGGAARAYYVGFEKNEPAVPGLAPRLDAVCIAPQGMEEGSEAAIATELGLVVGESAQFRFFASSKRKDDVAGAVVDVGADLVEVAPIEATLPGPPGVLVPVTLRSRVTELGTLELFAQETATAAQHKLEFSIRGD